MFCLTCTRAHPTSLVGIGLVAFASYHAVSQERRRRPSTTDSKLADWSEADALHDEDPVAGPKLKMAWSETDKLDMKQRRKHAWQ
jgi:hypothetical protein